MHTSYKAGKVSSWTEGFAKLQKCGDGTEARWVLSDMKQKPIKTMQVSSKHICQNLYSIKWTGTFKKTECFYTCYPNNFVISSAYFKKNLLYKPGVEIF